MVPVTRCNTNPAAGEGERGKILTKDTENQDKQLNG